ncbi:RHS domain-containing protein, partial [Parazoarcus communis]
CDVERDALHREVYRTQGRLASRFDYDPMGRLTRHRSSLAQAQAGRVQGARADAGTAVLERRYGWDAAGNLITRVDQLRGTQAFRYDPTGRILEATGPRPESFAFDPAGNLLDPIDRAIGYPALDNRIAVFEDLRFDYDTHGNVTRRRKGAHELSELSWNAEHQLAQSTVTRHGVTQTTRYEYDALGRRTRKRDAFGATEYLWDGDLMIESRRNNKSALYLYEPDSFVPLATVQHNETYWYHCDQIGAPMELTDADGRIVWAADYRVWGEATVRKTGTDGRSVSSHTPAPPPIEQPFRFQG